MHVCNLQEAYKLKPGDNKAKPFSENLHCEEIVLLLIGMHHQTAFVLLILLYLAITRK